MKDKETREKILSALDNCSETLKPVVGNCPLWCTELLMGLLEDLYGAYREVNAKLYKDNK